MKTSKRFLSSVLAVLIVVSAMAIGGLTASAASLKAPKGLSVTNANHSLIIKWGKVSGAKGYQLYKGSKLFQTVTSTSTRDYSVTGGQNCIYKVRAINGSKKGSFSSAVKCTRINFTVITSCVNVKSGIQLKWVARTGASKYLVERATADSFSSLGYVDAAELTYTDKTAVSGTTYKYRVTGYNASTKSASTPSVAVSITRLSSVAGVKAIKAADPSVRQINVTWTATSGADSYNVYRQKATDEDFVMVKNVTGTSYEDKDIIVNPSAYRYYVTAVKDTSESVKSAERVVQTYGTTPATLDANRNYHIPLTLNVDEEYAEGKHLAAYFSYMGNYEVTITEGSDVVSVEDDVIKAKKAGTAVVTITVPESTKSLIQDGLVSFLADKTVYLEITVA